MSNFNLLIGSLTNIEIAARDEEEKLVEIKYPNSLLYLGFTLPYYDINLHIIKYCPNINNSLSTKEKKFEYEDHQYCYEIFSLEQSTGAKIIIFIKNPGIYKILFDNKYSWFKSKLLRYRCTILKEINSFNLLTSSSLDNIKNINKNEINEEEKNEDKSDVKIKVKFENSSNIPNIDLEEEEEQEQNEDEDEENNENNDE